MTRLRALAARVGGTGFTLVEMLVVIAVIGILMSFLLATFGVIQERARQRETAGRVRSLVNALENYKSDVGIYPHPVSQHHGQESWIYALRERGYKPPYFDTRNIRNEQIFPNPVDYPTATNIYVMDSWGTQGFPEPVALPIVTDAVVRSLPVIRYWRQPMLHAPNTAAGTPNAQPYVYAQRGDAATANTLNWALGSTAAGTRWRGGTINVWSYGPNRVDNSSGSYTAAPFAGLSVGGDPTTVTAPDTDGIGDDVTSWAK